MTPAQGELFGELLTSPLFILFLIPWSTIAIAIGIVGNDRKIGGLTAFFASLILGPIIGLILTFGSRYK